MIFNQPKVQPGVPGWFDAWRLGRVNLCSAMCACPDEVVSMDDEAAQVSYAKTGAMASVVDGCSLVVLEVSG